MQDAVTRLACEVALRQLSGQKEDLRSLRNQASVLIALSAIIATVFSAISSEDILIHFSEGLSFLWFSLGGWFVLVTFSGSIFFAIRVTIFRRTVNFEISPNWILNEHESGKASDRIEESLARHAEKFFDDNEIVITGVHNDLFWAFLLCWLQIPSWLILIF